MIFQNAQLVFPDRTARGELRVRGGKIDAISEQRIPPEPGEQTVDLGGQFLAPGFIDLHIHGALGRDTMEADADAFRAICRYHASGGTTSLALTTVTATLEEILRVLDAVAAYRAASGSPASSGGGAQESGARVLGVHVEGPYFSKEKPGAHRLDLIRNPAPVEYEKILAHPGVITQMTLAPELPGAIALIDALRARGIRASGGHSDAWDEDARTAFEHGMRQVTHTFNCMSSARRRGVYRAAGLVEFAMSEPEILCELIADGRHVSPTLMRMLYQAKGADGIALVTDASAGAGLAEGATFRLGEIDCVVRDDVAVTADGAALAGSTANMARLVRNVVRLVRAPLHEAVRMATLNPARALGIEKSKGTLAAGADADLVVLSGDLEVVRTFVAGECVFAEK
jgi:N-acetylglucosamine-6-phosphate deacetylase